MTDWFSWDGTAFPRLTSEGFDGIGTVENLTHIEAPRVRTYTVISIPGVNCLVCLFREFGCFRLSTLHHAFGITY